MSTSTYTVGVDPAKRKFTACLVGPAGEEVFPARDFEYMRAGLDELAALLDTRVESGARLFVGVESSASYDDNLLAFFQRLRERRALTLLRVDCAQVKHFSGARPVRGKTDRADARRIAAFTRQYAAELDRFEADPQAECMHRLINERLQLADDLVALKNRLRDRLIGAFPEFEGIFRDPSEPLALLVLEKAPTAQAAAKKRPSTLSGLQAAKGGEFVGGERAQKLVELAKASIASASGPIEENAVCRLIERIRMGREQIEATEAELAEFASSCPAVITGQEKAPTLPQEIQLLDSIRGIGIVGASAIVLRSRGVGRFASAKALAAQLGTCPSRDQTGSSRDTAHLTHRGDRRARNVLYMLTQVACVHDPAMAFHKYRLVQKGKTKKQALCACMNRMSHVAWALVHTRTPYDQMHAITNASRQHPALWKEFVENTPGMQKRVEKATVKAQRRP